MNCSNKSLFGFKGTLDSLQWLFDVPLGRLIGFAIVSYFSGWHYLNAYFLHFNVNRWSYSFDDYTIFLYSFFMLVELPNILWPVTYDVLMAPIFLFICLLLSAIKPPERFLTAKNIVGRLLIAVGSLWCLYEFSVEAGHISADEVSRDLENRRILLTLTEDFHKSVEEWRDVNYANQLSAELRLAGRQGRLGLIWRNSNETLILLNDADGKPVTTYRIPNRFIVLIDAKMEDGQ